MIRNPHHEKYDVLALSIASHWLKILFPRPHTSSSKAKMAAWAKDIGIEFSEFYNFLECILNDTVRTDLSPEQINTLSKGIIKQCFKKEALHPFDKFRDSMHDIATELGLTLNYLLRLVEQLLKHLVNEIAATTH